MYKPSDSPNTIHCAAFYGDILELEYVFFAEGNINKRDPYGATPLHHAAYSGSVECVAFIIAHGGNVNSEDEYGQTPLQHASAQGNFDCVKFLTEQGALVNSEDREKSTPLHKSTLNGHTACAEFLISKGANLNCQTFAGLTPLHYCAMSGNGLSTKLLLDSGANVNCIDKEGATPLHKAAFRGETLCASILLDYGANRLAKDDDGCSPLHSAINSSSSRVDIIELLIGNHELDVDCEDGEKITPLHQACYFKNVDFTKKLITLGAKVDHQDKYLSTPLHKAAFSGSKECAQALIEKGAKVDVVDEEGAYPIHKAAFNGHVNVCRVLLENGASIESKDKDGASVLHKAAFMGRNECLAFLCICKANVQSRDTAGGTPLHSAVFKSHVECTKILLQHRSDPAAGDANGCTPLHVAASVGSIECIEILLTSLSDVNLTDSEGKSPLFYAVRGGQEDCIRLLRKRGAEFTSVDIERITPGDLKIYGVTNTTQLLELLKHDENDDNMDEGKRLEIIQEISKPLQVEPAKQEKLKEAINLFNRKPEKGVDLLISEKFIQNTPLEIAKFLHQMTEDLDKKKVGEFLGESKYVPVLTYFVELVNFSGLQFDIALRRFLQKFWLPGEAQKVDRILQKFAYRYFKDNSSGVFSSAETAYVLAFSLIILNTDAHKAAIKKEDKMTRQQFVANNQGIDVGKDLPKAFLEELYTRIVEDPIEMDDVGTQFQDAEKRGWLYIKNKYSWKRRWTLLCNDAIYFFKRPGEVAAIGSIPLDKISPAGIAKGEKRSGKRFCFKLTVSKDGNAQQQKGKTISHSANPIANQEQVYTFAAESESDMNCWIKMINNLLKSPKNKKFITL